MKHSARSNSSRAIANGGPRHFASHIRVALPNWATYRHPQLGNSPSEAYEVSNGLRGDDVRFSAGMGFQLGWVMVASGVRRSISGVTEVEEEHVYMGMAF